eukprot:scaffold16903_cov133-Isochrysis_galbana.AAC.9
MSSSAFVGPRTPAYQERVKRGRELGRARTHHRHERGVLGGLERGHRPILVVVEAFLAYQSRCTLDAETASRGHTQSRPCQRAEPERMPRA